MIKVRLTLDLCSQYRRKELSPKCWCKFQLIFLQKLDNFSFTPAQFTLTIILGWDSWESLKSLATTKPSGFWKILIKNFIVTKLKILYDFFVMYFQFRMDIIKTIGKSFFLYLSRLHRFIYNLLTRRHQDLLTNNTSWQ